ncbi:MAG: tetratricopeptide repeat protein [Candidatus Omnitrophota bacterium]|nr:tetratricopeptide repeat protein [Candidatus Omnitrophota bacterium]
MRNSRPNVRRWWQWVVAAALLATLGHPSPSNAGDPPTQPVARPDATTRADSDLIPAETFISSPFSTFLKAGDFRRALDALDVLEKQYPNDPLIMRYRAIVLDHLGRYDEALDLYAQLLARDPNHAPTRFFRAQTYHRMGKREEATKELEWVKEHSPSKEYRVWAQEELRRPGATAERRAERKKFYLFGNTGWEYDSNIPLKSNDPGVTTQAGDQNASRLLANLGLGYRAIQQRGNRLDFTYTTRQSLNDDSLNEFNFTSQELAAEGRRRVELWDREVTLGARYELSGGFLDGDTFSLDNQLRLSSDVRLTPRTRTYLYNRFTASDYGKDGSNPPQTSRDGFGYDAGLTQYFYSEDFRSYAFAGQEFNLDETRGANFTRRGLTMRWGVHVPVPKAPKTDLDAALSFQFGKYPRFTSLSTREPDRRHDTNWNTYVSLTHRLRPRLSLRVFWRVINANNRNDVFQYDRQVAGVQTLFTQHF